MRMTTQETHSVIASDRLEGTPVRSTNGTRIGMIERVMIDQLTGNVVYVVLNLDGLVGEGQKRLPISWARLTYDRKLGDYHLDLTEVELRSARSEQNFDWGDRGRTIEIQENYTEQSCQPYWGIAERW